VRSNIALIGMMGSGKSTVGKRLAEHLNGLFVDLDEWIEKRSGKPIWRIFEEDGESAFRSLERQGLRELTDTAGRGWCVLSTGGGIVTSPDCCQWLRTNWVALWLDASVETLVHRLSEAADRRRPLLDSATSLDERVRTLLAARRPLYEACSHWRVRVDGQSVEDTVEAILRYLTEDINVNDSNG
jgi:shikimate kinase